MPHPSRILIVGAGVAGTTLAAFLARRGISPTIVDRLQPGAGSGYMLGLLPIGGDVLRALGVFDRYLAESCAMRRYELFDRNGRALKSVSLASIASRPGAYRGVERGRLLDVLRGGAHTSEVQWGSGVSRIEEHRDRVVVGFDDGSSGEYDCVVGADGIRSTTGRLMFGESAGTIHRTGWGGWVLWAPGLAPDDDSYRELWGTGWMVGLYPVPGRLGIFLGGRTGVFRSIDDAVRRIKSKLPRGPFRDALASAVIPDNPHFWPMDDQRSPCWQTKRVVLLGDAATGFLPTAGVGASMAMESAHRLAEALASADPAHLGQSLSAFASRQKSRVEKAQAASRTLARLMFVDAPATAFLRDQVMRITPDRLFVKSVEDLLSGK